MIVPDLDILRILAATPIQSHQTKCSPNDRMNRIPVLNMKKGDALAKNLGFVIGLNSQALSCVQPTQPPLQLVQDSLVHCLQPLPGAPGSTVYLVNLSMDRRLDKGQVL